MPCIYCLTTKVVGPRAKAHIFPESIFGDHDDLVLTEEALCLDCNQGFAHAESAPGPSRDRAEVLISVWRAS